MRYEHAAPEPRRDISGILDEYSQFHRVLLGRAGARRDPPALGEAGKGQAGMGQPSRAGPVSMVAELCGALRSQLRRVAARARPGMFYLLETAKEPFFDRVKVPCLLQLKLCPSVVFAGVDDPQDVTSDTFQELFQAGGFVVSDEELLERVTLGQLQEVVKVLEKLNRNGRWKWLLHHRESKKLRGDLRWCQGEELLELLPFHGCDCGAAPESRRVQCLLELHVQHIHARFAVYLTENPSSSSSREILESKGILVADINTFLGTVQKVAAPFRRSYW
ncbi:Protein transcription activation suppressor family member 2 [Lamprotornis superbus]|uniref:Protein transcription activation suppressor family member 2 n=1 Tax=Lamprotornis superbus TaxID=245042 RepID=A0A835TNY7_9PASS|nr:Protein transcription activation suppressor family member 2 [Lamprotornis superbus]